MITRRSVTFGAVQPGLCLYSFQDPEPWGCAAEIQVGFYQDYALDLEKGHWIWNISDEACQSPWIRTFCQKIFEQL